MKLKQALIIGLSSSVLAIPAIAAESITDLSKDAKTMKPMTMEMPAKKEAIHHRKGHKKVSMEEKKVGPKQEKGNAKLDELNTLNSDSSTTDPEKDQTEKDSIAS